MANTLNFSAHVASDSKLDFSRYINIISLSGCNQVIRGYNNRYLYIIIPNEYINEFTVDSGITLEQYMEELKIFGVKSNIITTENTQTYNFIVSSYFLNDSTIFELDINDYDNSARLRYFAFCLIRHLYYFQPTMLEYFKNVESYTEESDKIKLLSETTKRYCKGYTYLIGTMNTSTSIKSIQNIVIKYGNHNLSVFSSNYESYPELSIQESIAKNNQNYQKVTDFIENRDSENYKYVVVPNNKCFEHLRKTTEHLILADRQHLVLKVTNEQHAILSPFMNKRDYFGATFNLYPNSSPYRFKEGQIQSIYIKDLKHLENGVDFDIEGYKQYKNSLMIVNIRSRHPSHNVFRRVLKSDRSVVIRLGSTTKLQKEYDLEINSVDAITKSSNKLLMKREFNSHQVPTTNWSYNISEYLTNINTFPVIAKNVYGSRGTGNHKLDTKEDLLTFESTHKRNIKHYIFEEFFNSAKEYRIHVSTKGVFLMWRKLRTSDTPADQRWFFNNQNCNWVGEDNVLFDAPSNIELIKEECIKALHSVGLDIGACDVRVQSNRTTDGKRRKNPVFKIIEINSAPSMATITADKYIEEFKKIINSD
jgi:glutathione synthase/RimK-type ligase-like ATP-grasp enzyme